MIRGLSPIPGAFFEFEGKLIKIYKTEIVEREDLKPLEFDQTKKELIVGCGEKALRILELQQEGKKRMKVEEFLRGFRF